MRRSPDLPRRQIEKLPHSDLLAAIARNNSVKIKAKLKLQKNA
jgi:hypothetical protein